MLLTMLIHYLSKNIYYFFHLKISKVDMLYFVAECVKGGGVQLTSLRPKKYTSRQQVHVSSRDTSAPCSPSRLSPGTALVHRCFITKEISVCRLFFRFENFWLNLQPKLAPPLPKPKLLATSLSKANIVNIFLDMIYLVSLPIE